MSVALAFVVAVALFAVLASAADNACRFATDYSCNLFRSFDLNNDKIISDYLDQVMQYEGQGFAQPGIGYDPKTGYTYDGHPINYNDATLYGEPHLFSAPSKESIHLGMLALALKGDKHALKFTGGFEATLNMLRLKMDGYMAFNATYPGFGCFHPWVGFNLEAGTFDPIDSWTKPYYKVPGLDNGEMFWSIYAISHLLDAFVASTPASHPQHALASSLAVDYRAFKECEINSAKTIFYRGDGDVSAVVYILDVKKAPVAGNYIQADGYLNDPYEGETLTQLMYLLSPDWESDEEREILWTKKRGLFSAVNYTIPAADIGRDKDAIVTVQRGYWFSTHEQWKLLLLPYISDDLPLVRRVFANAERARTWDAVRAKSPGLLASINDVTNGGQDIPDYISAAGVQEIAYQEVQRRDVLTPYGSFGLMLFDRPAGLCWYNNMLSGPRMQSKYGSTEAINVNGTMISPLTTWDSKITTVLGMLGGIGDIVGTALKHEVDPILKDISAYKRFVNVVAREHEMIFGEGTGFTGDDVPIQVPNAKVPTDQLTEWVNPCGN